jgi:hypothetical protein
MALTVAQAIEMLSEFPPEFELGSNEVEMISRFGLGHYSRLVYTMGSGELKTVTTPYVKFDMEAALHVTRVDNRGTSEAAYGYVYFSDGRRLLYTDREGATLLTGGWGKVTSRHVDVANVAIGYDPSTFGEDN